MHLQSSNINYLSYSQERFVSLVILQNGLEVYYTRFRDYELLELYYKRSSNFADLRALPDDSDTFSTVRTNFCDSPGYFRL